METDEVEINGVRFERQYWQVIQPQIARLMAAGLRVDGPREASKEEHEFSFRISKPKLTPGNSVPSTDAWCGFSNNDRCDSDAPSLTLATDNGAWVVSTNVQLGPSHGDFIHIYDRFDEAVGDVLDYYFGNPIRIQTKWRGKALG